MRRVAWFVVVGCAAAAVHLGVVKLLVSQLGWLPLVANVAGWLLAFCVSFAGHWQIRAARRFFFISFTGFSINEAMYAVLLRLVGDDWYLVVLFFVLLSVAVITYLLSSRWAFRGTGPT
jgi:putative flippase GtrA